MNATGFRASSTSILPATVRRLAVVAIAAVALTACAPGPGDGLIAASCEPVAASQVAGFDPAMGVQSGSWSTTERALAAEHAPFVPGDVLIRFRDDPTRASLPSRVTAAGHALDRVRALGLTGSALYRAPGLDRAATLAAISALANRPDVALAHPNYIVSRAATPTDDDYVLQWSIPDIDLPPAWDITVSCEQIAVAVLDTGMLMNHPDRPTHLAGGYDFVSDPSNLDGDGRDGDPKDPGPSSETDYHGSHVVGTVGAATNNDLDGDGRGEGIAGTTWRSTVVPVRVLGPEGLVSDIIDAMLWASGASVDGVPDNPSPARIINLSLGGTFDCSATLLQSAVETVRARGSIPIAAAGNDGVDARGTGPANCDGVLAVGATTPSGDRASYSNFGATVDLMAPGGGTGAGEGIWSLSRNDLTTAHTYAYLSGTSMATAHVSGVVGLMLSVRPDLTVGEVESVLAATTHPLTDAQCDGGHPTVTLTSADCGAGKIDAFDAVTAAQNW